MPVLPARPTTASATKDPLGTLWLLAFTLRLGRSCIGIDLNPEYLDIAVARLQDPAAKCLDGAGNRLPWRPVTIIR